MSCSECYIKRIKQIRFQSILIKLFFCVLISVVSRNNLFFRADWQISSKTRLATWSVTLKLYIYTCVAPWIYIRVCILKRLKDCDNLHECLEKRFFIIRIVNVLGRPIMNVHDSYKLRVLCAFCLVILKRARFTEEVCLNKMCIPFLYWWTFIDLSSRYLHKLMQFPFKATGTSFYFGQTWCMLSSFIKAPNTIFNGNVTGSRALSCV